MREPSTSLTGGVAGLYELVAEQQRRNKVSPDVSRLEAGKEHTVAPIHGRMLLLLAVRRHLYVARVYGGRKVPHVRHLR